MQTASVTERRLAGLVILAAMAALVVLIAIAGPFFRTYDESKYVGIGLNVFAGDGPRTALGVWFQPHSPLWPVVMTAPQVWFGVPALAWGQILNALSGAGILAIVGILGARIRPLIGAIAVIAYFGAPYLQDLSRTARLDVPVAFVILAYLVVGIEAVRRDSVVLGLVAGAVIGVAFLIKEIALPMAPVPFLAGILLGRRFASIARVAAAAALVAAIVTSWWFVMFASYTHKVYRLGAPDRWLIPLYIAAGVAIALGLAAPWLARRIRVRTGLDSTRARRSLAWGLAVVWFAAFVMFFDRNPELKGTGIISLGQYRLYLTTWLPAAGGPLILVVLAGLVLAIPARLRLGGPAALWFDIVVLALLCGAPLVMLVVAVGEPPRNYLVQIGLLLIVAATGWTYALMRIVRSRWESLDGERDPTPTRPLALAPALTVVLALGLATAALAVHSVRTRQPGDSAPARAVAAAAAWINANAGPNDRIGFGSYLGYETSVDMPGHPNLVPVTPTLAVLDPRAPLGLAMNNTPPVDDWLAIDISRREREFLVFRSSTFAKTIADRQVRYYVYLTGPYTSVPSLLAALTPEHGFTLVESGTYESAGANGNRQSVGLHIFRVQLDAVRFDGAKIGMSPAALDRMSRLLAADAATAPATAAALIDRVITYPDGAAAAPFLDRLRGPAGR